ncbi:zinc-binding dehydrogenase [Duganella violaceipulchra]|uniref:NADPH:quinone reductase-like Zn-dependent oxidoreductase n=1 Tax=Duganella violaceipulchra TaxID=2849652 RepID=A0AA41L4I8_9BURK|nr:zinc-binding dehydrogenase [Duganella violaceicalia]MBV6325348.1 zinc-binding dehydrogenase [Duganella violaceicalia]MCP2012548.1 NADPH:quinone reductase-like Zn-dependent oxidoreductase [Duganella violaceicalia]
MRAIHIAQFGGPEQLQLIQLPTPAPANGQVLIRVRAFGLNRAESYMRRGLWGEVARVTGIECVGEVTSAPGTDLRPGQKIAAIMGGMGRSINGSYAEYVCVPASNVVPLRSSLSWAELAAIPESYATAWACLHDNLELRAGQTLLIRGASSALGQAASNIAAHLGARVIATTRRPVELANVLRKNGARDIVEEQPSVAAAVRAIAPAGVDAVLDLIGNTTLLDSLAVAARPGRVCQAGFLGGLEALSHFLPLQHLPPRVQLSFFGSFAFGTPGFELDRVPLQDIVERVEQGRYHARPAEVFAFDDIIGAHRYLDAGAGLGKAVVQLEQ